MLLDLADFALQEQPEDNLMLAISRAWYNGHDGPYTMPPKPIKSLELHYAMIQFLIIVFRIPHPETEETATSKGLWDSLGRRMDITPMNKCIFRLVVGVASGRVA